MKDILGMIAATSVLALSIASAQAAEVTVDPWHTAGNYSATWPALNYSVPDLVLSAYSKSGWGNATITDQTAIYAMGFSDLQGVSYTSEPVGDIGLMPLLGNAAGVTLYDFDLGAWAGVNSNVAVRIYNGDYSQILSQGTVAVGAQHGSYLANVFSLNGLHIQFASSLSTQHAIDNIRLEGGNPLNISPIPEPETYAMMLAGLGLVGLSLRRKQQQASA